MPISADDPLFTLITGASGGIGADLAREFAAHGHNVILVARSEKKLHQLAGELQDKHGIEAETIALDLSAHEAPDILRSTVSQRRLAVDILINNAGVLVSGKFSGQPLSEHLQLLQLNISALTAITHLFLPEMLQRGAGRIMNIASTSAFQPVPTLATYAASKAYVLSFSEAIAMELKGCGVSVTALCPGFTETDMIVKTDGKSMSLPLMRNMTSPEVARQGYTACMKGKPLYINGLGNKAFAEFVKHQPRWVQRLMNTSISKDGF